MPTLAEVDRAVRRLWPAAGAEDWDAVGLVSGDPDAVVESIRLAVDAVADTVDEALAEGDDLLLVHHPLLLRGVTSIAEDRYKGALLARLVRGGCALLAAHTNADVVDTGTSAVLAERLGLLDLAPIVPSGHLPEGTDTDSDTEVRAAARHGGLGRVGRFPAAVPLGRVAGRLAELLPPTASGVRVAGEYEREIGTVAVCAGAGDALLSHRLVVGADLYVTSDLRHHPASEARERALLGAGPALIDVSHWASEWLWLETAAAEMRDALPDVRVSVSELRTDPWDFAITQ